MKIRFKFSKFSLYTAYDTVQPCYKDYYTTIISSGKMNDKQIFMKANRNLRNQISKETGIPVSCIEIDNRDLFFEIY